MQGEQTSVQDIAAFFRSKDSSTVTGPPLIIQPRANTAPRFVSPLTGVMADEGASVVLEAQIDGMNFKNHCDSMNLLFIY